MKDIENRRLLLFALLTVVFLVALSLIYYQSANPNILLLLMLSTTVAVILTRIITREGLKDLYIKPNIKGNIRWYAFAYILTPIIAYFGAVVYFLIFPNDFDPLNSAYAVSGGITSTSQYVDNLLIVMPLAIIVNPLMGIIQCLGEEFAWRAYLLPKLCKKFNIIPALLLSGVIWGAWHSPIVVMGYNYGAEYHLFGVLAMVVFCIVLGIISAYLFFVTKSVWAPTLFHAAINGMDLWAPSTLFMSNESNKFIGPDLLGVIGGMGFIVVASMCLLDIHKNPQRFRIFS